ncbi:hypothetical protein LJC52_02000 [Bacteroidales bacterium OttesenSCG-928-A17]|nr:hypothetical protein [Bacteroidales bacterium OttesenSCG-928-A17]
MNKEIFFFERQRFRQWWVISLLVVIDGIFIAVYMKQLLSGSDWGNNQPHFLLGAFLLLFTVWFLSARLDVEVNEDGIYWRFFLLEFKSHFLSWDEISNCEVITYNPMRYGGWGLKVGGFNIVRVKGINVNLNRKLNFPGFNKTNVYSVSGNKALSLETISGQKILIGIQNADELSEILTKLHDKRNKK